MTASKTSSVENFRFSTLLMGEKMHMKTFTVHLTLDSIKSDKTQ